MLTHAEEKKIRSLQTKKGRREHGLCLVEGQKVINAAGKRVVETFTANDTKNFAKLVTTVTPQMVAGIARIPEWSLKDVLKRDVVVVLDHVQDPGNVGAALRLCLGFDAGLIFINSADPTSPKVIRASAGAMFIAPWVQISEQETRDILEDKKIHVIRLEKRKGSKSIRDFNVKKPLALIIGSEGQGIQLETPGATSIHIPHNSKLESLNAASALAIALFNFRG